MTFGTCDRFSDLSPDEIHRNQQRIAAAFGDAFAAAMADEDFGPECSVECLDIAGVVGGEPLVPHPAGVVLPQPRPR
jgi:hypothetical protein